MVVDQLTQHHDHDNRSGQVVEHGREEEGDEGYFPQQRALGARMQHIAHKVEAAVGVDDFHNGHGSHEEEERFGDFAEMLAQDVRGNKIHHTFARFLQCSRMEARHIFGGAKGVEHPARHTHEECHCGLVDFDHVFKGDAEIPKDEDRDNEGSEHKLILRMNYNELAAANFAKKKNNPLLKGK